ncbi:hypothetical protein ACHAW6_005120 [Cyclotella cf. meneghiniana]
MQILRDLHRAGRVPCFPEVSRAAGAIPRETLEWPAGNSVAKTWRSRRGGSGLTGQDTHGAKCQERQIAGMMPKSGKHVYNLLDKTNSKPKKKAKSIIVPTGKLALDVTVLVETVPVANPGLVLAMDPISMLLLIALKVAHPGQPCHPDIEQHQDAIGEALSIEIRRNDVEEHKAMPISKGISAFTHCGNNIRESDSEHDSSDEE